MIFAGFTLFLVFLSAVPLFGAVCLGRRPERLFAAGLLANGLVFYLFCAVNLCGFGFYLIFAADLALYIPVALKLRKDPGAFRKFPTPAVAVLYAALTAGFLLARREFPLYWDEFSHWASSAKFLFEHGKLNCEFPRLLGHASYPPGLAVLDTLVHKCFIGMGFCDFMPRFAVRALKICIFILPFGDTPRRASFRECAAGMLILWLAASLLFPDGNFTCESDCVLGIVFAAAVYVVMRHDRSAYDDLFLALLLGWLFLIKKAGTGFAVMVQLLYLVRWIADRRSGTKPRRPVWSALVVLAAPFLLQMSWSLLLKVHRTPIKFPVGDISPARIARLVRYGEPDYWRQVAARFARGLLRELPFVLAVAGALAWLRKKTEDRPRRLGDLRWFLPLAFAVYLASLFLTYLFIFNDYQALHLVSFRRYVHGFLIMPLGAALMLVFSGGLTVRLRRILTSYTVLALLTLGVGWLYIQEHARAYRLNKEWIGDRAVLEARYGKLLRAPGARFVAVSGAGNGVYHPILKYEYEDRFVDETALNGPERKMSAAELREFVRQARYVLIVRPPKELPPELAALWRSPPELRRDFTLFEVAPEGYLRPVR